ATDEFVVKSGDDFYAATVDDTDGSVGLIKAVVNFSDTDNGVTGPVALADQLVKVGANEAGTATAFVTLQGGNYKVDDGLLAADGTHGATVALSGATPTAQF